nr:hypothetical protein [Tanacetum cinerariifolium]
SINLHPTQSINNLINVVPVKLEMETSQYTSWAELFKIHCRAHDVIDHLTSSTPPTPKDKEPVITLETWSRQDAIVLQWIHATISKDLMHTILEPNTTAKKAWDRLKDIFQDNKHSRALALEHLFSNSQLDNFLNISAYCQELKMLSDHLLTLVHPYLMTVWFCN